MGRAHSGRVLRASHPGIHPRSSRLLLPRSACCSQERHIETSSKAQTGVGQLDMASSAISGRGGASPSGSEGADAAGNGMDLLLDSYSSMCSWDGMGGLLASGSKLGLDFSSAQTGGLLGLGHALGGASGSAGTGSAGAAGAAGGMEHAGTLGPGGMQRAATASTAAGEGEDLLLDEHQQAMLLGR